MPLLNCKECKNEVSNSASKCPHCGVSHPGIKKGNPIFWFISIVIALTSIMMIFSNDITVDSDDLDGKILDSEKYSSSPSIYLINEETQFFTLNIKKSDIELGNILVSKNNESSNIELSANWDGDHFIESTNHGTVAMIEITNIDKDNHTITIDISANLVETSKNRYIMINKGSVVISNIYL